MPLTATISVAGPTGSCVIRFREEDLEIQSEVLQRLAEAVGNTAEMLDEPEQAQRALEGLEFLRTEQRKVEKEKADEKAVNRVIQKQSEAWGAKPEKPTKALPKAPRGLSARSEPKAASKAFRPFASRKATE
ncbi:unnamed protein product [Effrenium voratum]|uniref:Uncharacterized protein n=1 Tax=Effrenium voratum TaxID=2562239 RepID=A0AA36JBD4_9DINO|nr:unnamed protein product [Effrenium voratum]CAJ1403090.1 unnamed protein product [Effrenium voratum]CAJ1435100.1 unnamed protein product [Effrenium voratum]